MPRREWRGRHFPPSTGKRHGAFASSPVKRLKNARTWVAKSPTLPALRPSLIIHIADGMRRVAMLW